MTRVPHDRGGGPDLGNFFRPHSKVHPHVHQRSSYLTVTFSDVGSSWISLVVLGSLLGTGSSRD